MEANETKKTPNKKVATTKRAAKKTSTSINKTSGTKKTTTKTAVKKGTTTKKTSTTTKKTVKKPTPKVASEVKEEKVITKIEVNKTNDMNKIKKEKLEEELTSKKYISIVAIVLAVVLISIMLSARFNGPTKKELASSYLIKNKIVNTEMNKKDIANILNNEKTFIFLTSLNNKEEYQLEKKLKKVIEENKIQNDFYIYDLNVADIELNKTFNLNNKNLKIPTILYYKNGKLIDIVEREDAKMIEVGDFSKLLDIYELSK